MELESSAILDLLEGLETQDGAGRLQQLELLQASLEHLLVSVVFAPHCNVSADQPVISAKKGIAITGKTCWSLHGLVSIWLT